MIAIKGIMKYNTYLIKEKNTGLYKIGKSNDPLRRFYTLRTANIHIDLVGISSTKEKQLHNIYDEYRISGEWFDFNDSTINEESLLKYFTPYDEVYNINPENKLVLTDVLVETINKLNNDFDSEKVSKLMDVLFNTYGAKQYGELLEYKPFNNLVTEYTYMNL
ncbi:GIY-YIG nuclease family protein [Mariniflexile gromovii]|uniref:GIY-YIG nuclease family protein n=1 Tax=Mariniflexile gromovii TaxID=362523 RepID=A0ABS4BW98_9FLAO|nr:GIY-YIG nuclease family protein [Mariniflexile gromovii]MBP0904868.1 GIY-YIG nuclease family protein [Mariniflexile gromovii]